MNATPSGGSQGRAGCISHVEACKERNWFSSPIAPKVTPHLVSSPSMGVGAGAQGLHVKLQDSDTLHMNVLMRDWGGGTPS